MGSRELGLECDAEQAPVKTTAMTVEPRTTIGSGQMLRVDRRFHITTVPRSRENRLRLGGAALVGR